MKALLRQLKIHIAFLLERAEVFGFQIGALGLGTFHICRWMSLDGGIEEEEVELIEFAISKALGQSCRSQS